MIKKGFSYSVSGRFIRSSDKVFEMEVEQRVKIICSNASTTTFVGGIK